MSSANRGCKRRTNDAYYTPDKLADALVGCIEPYFSEDDTFLEPHAGGGAFVRALNKRSCYVEAIDINPDVGHATLMDGANSFLQADYLHTDVDAWYHWIIGNPPFQNAMDHVMHSFDQLSADGNLCFLLRLAFLESKKRAAFWKEHPAHKIWVLSERPSFTGGKTDSCAYGFFWWTKTPVNYTQLEVLSWK